MTNQIHYLQSGSNYFYVPSEYYEPEDFLDEISAKFSATNMNTGEVVTLNKRSVKLIDDLDVIPARVRRNCAENLQFQAYSYEVQESGGYSPEDDLLDIDDEDAWKDDIQYKTVYSSDSTEEEDELTKQLNALDSKGYTAPNYPYNNPVEKAYNVPPKHYPVPEPIKAGKGLSFSTPSEAKDYVDTVTYNKSQTINQPTKSNNMSFKNLLGSLNLEFGKYTNGNLALSFSGIAVRRKQGDWVSYDRANKTLIEVGDLKFDVDFYRIPVQQLAAGDITEIDGQILIVNEIKSDGTINCSNPATGSTTNKIKRSNLMNMHFYTKIVSMFEMFNGGAASPFGGSANQGGGAQASPFGNINPMMLMMMSGGDKGEKGGMDSMMEMMMMSQMFGGAQGGGNPFAAFGQQAAPAVEAPVERTSTTTTA
jgi:hypothetical protein